MEDITVQERKSEKSMIRFNEKQEDYRKNLVCMEEATDRLLGHMKGHGCSFRQEITDSKGNFSQKKLCGLVKKLLEFWAKTLREGTDTDPDTRESLAEPYILERRELYGLYLYLVMRCSLCEGAYANAYPYGFVTKEQTNFAFLLEQARRLSRKWCVMAGPDGKKRNELYEGYDEHFGFHLYKTLMNPDGRNDDCALSPWWKRQDHLDYLTNEGNMKRIYIRHLSGSFQGIMDEKTATGENTVLEKTTAQVKAAVQAKEIVQAEDYCDAVETDSTGSGSGYENDYDGYKNNYDGYEDNKEGYKNNIEGYKNNEEDYDDEADEDYDGYEYDDDDDPYPFPDFETKAEFEAARMEHLTQEYERADYLAALALNFACKAEYLEACRRFTALFETARPEILWGFYQELEKIVNLYLAEQNLAPLVDTDKTLDVYSRVSDGPCQQASSYERRQQWKNP